MYDDIDEGDVLWVTPDVCHVPELPDGFALRVDEFLGRDYDSPDQRRVWVRGAVLLDTRGATRGSVVVRVPIDQPRAVPQPSSRAAEPELLARAGGGAHRADDRRMVQHGGRLYRRMEVPGP